MYPLRIPSIPHPVDTRRPATPETSLPASKILLLDADTDFAETIQTALTGVGYTVTSTASSDAGTLHLDVHVGTGQVRVTR